MQKYAFLINQACKCPECLERMEISKNTHRLLQTCLWEFCTEGKFDKTKDQMLEENMKVCGNNCNSKFNISKKKFNIPEGYLHSILPMFLDILSNVRENDRDHICCEQTVFTYK